MREKLLETAIDHFGRLGFEGAATRAIAAETGTAMSSITYHFGSKHGLYLATAEHIAAQISTLQGPAKAQIECRDPKSREEAVAAMVELIDAMAVLMLREKVAKLARFVIREQQEPTEAFDIIFNAAMSPMVKAMLPILAIARPDLSEVEHRASGFLLVGQTLVLRSGRASMARVLGKGTITPEIEALMRQRICTHVRCILSAEPEQKP